MTDERSMQRSVRFCVPAIWTVTALAFLIVSASSKGAWKRHTIDDVSRGADGVRMADVNGDHRPDIATGWEEGGAIRVCLNPGLRQIRQHWPAVTVGEVQSPEDAVFVDLDADGAADVVSSCEGRNRTVYVHWAPPAPEEYLKPSRWLTEPILVTQGMAQWMYALPMDIDGRHGIDLVVGSKGDHASVGWLEAPAKARQLAAWRYHPLYAAGWIMSIEPYDLDRDGDSDLVVSDRKGPNRGVLWLENPGNEASAVTAPWAEHRIGAGGVEVSFLALGDLGGRGRLQIVVTTFDGRLFIFTPEGVGVPSWTTETVPLPLGHQRGKGVRIGDIDLDGRDDIAISVEAGQGRPSVFWLSRPTTATSKGWVHHDIGGLAGTKFDLVQLVDLDDDGDLDLVTCEETENLGVFWYENPTR